jgi:hypothetical protein
VGSIAVSLGRAFYRGYHVVTLALLINKMEPEEEAISAERLSPEDII